MVVVDENIAGQDIVVTSSSSDSNGDDPDFVGEVR